MPDQELQWGRIDEVDRSIDVGGGAGCLSVCIMHTEGLSIPKGMPQTDQSRLPGTDLPSPPLGLALNLSQLQPKP